MTKKPTDGAYFATRFPFDPKRKGVWREIVQYVDRDLVSHESLLELGPGYCDFVNQVDVARKYAVDADEIAQQHAAADVHLHIGTCTDLSHIASSSVANVFASNLLEHLHREELEQLMDELGRVLQPGGRILLIQPNYRLCSANYFDDYTHVSVFSDISLCDFLAAHGFQMIRCVPGLLPFSMKPSIPKHPLLVRLYLRSPIRPLARQMYVVAEKGR